MDHIIFININQLESFCQLLTVPAERLHNRNQGANTSMLICGLCLQKLSRLTSWSILVSYCGITWATIRLNFITKGQSNISVHLWQSNKTLDTYRLDVFFIHLTNTYGDLEVGRVRYECFFQWDKRFRHLNEPLGWLKRNLSWYLLSWHYEQATIFSDRDYVNLKSDGWKKRLVTCYETRTKIKTGGRVWLSSIESLR